MASNLLCYKMDKAHIEINGNTKLDDLDTERGVQCAYWWDSRLKGSKSPRIQ